MDKNAFNALTDKEFAVLYWKMQGYKHEDIGRKWGYEAITIQKWLSEAHRKLGIPKKMHPSRRAEILENEIYPAFREWIENHPEKIKRLSAPPDEEPQEEPQEESEEPLPPPPPLNGEIILEPDTRIVVIKKKKEPQTVPIWIILAIFGILIIIVGITAYWVGQRNTSPIPAQLMQTETSVPSSTLLSPTSSLEPTLTNTLEPTLTLTLIPTDTLVPTATETITPIPTETKSPLGLGKGDELSDNRVTLKLIDVKYNEKYDRLGSRVAPISYYFDFTNHSGETIVLQFDSDNFKTTDDMGSEANCWFYHISGAGEKVNEPLNSGVTRQIVARCGLGSLDPNIKTITLTVYPFSSLPESAWIVQIPH